LIREILTYLSESPLIPEAKSFGHLSESISLLSREERCKKAWFPHRTKCKEFITSHLQSAIHFRSVLVLGSGPLHEIPIEELSRKFNKVVLVDIVHLKSTKNSVKHLHNIEFVEHEISEIEHILKKDKKLIEKIPDSFKDTDWGLVLSVNVMSQLPLHLKTYIKKKLTGNFLESQVKKYLEAVTENHLNYLTSFSCPIFLITDVETVYTDGKDVLLQKDINFAHLTMPKYVDEWTWNLAPIPEFDKNIAIKMLVSAFILNSSK
jgi:hypothetical protein